MIVFRRWGGVAALLLVLSPAVCRADADNPLLGRWKLTAIGYLDRDGHNYCEPTTEMEFTATQQTMFEEAMPSRPAAQGTTRVIYLVSGSKIYVSSTAGFFNAPSYTMLSADQMEPDTMGHCTYTKE